MPICHPSRSARSASALIAAALAATCLLCAAVADVRAAADSPSLSKLSIHLILNYTPGAQQIVQAHPRVLKILDTHTSMIQAMREYKQTTPGGMVVLRIYTPKRYTLQDNPYTAADDFWNNVLWPPISRLSAADRALIDYVEGPNEADSTPTWNSAAETAWYNAFWLKLAPHISNAGFRPCAYSISVGNPPGSIDEIHQTLDRIVPSLRLIKTLGGAWSYHPYTILYTKDPQIEIWYSLRYRQYYSYFRQKYPDLADLPLIFTEGGVDGQSSPQGAGWKGGGDAAKFQDWLAWWDNEIRKDSYVLGATLFQSGDTAGWNSFDIEPIAGWLASHLSSQRATGNPSQAKEATPQTSVSVSRGVVSAAWPGVLYVQSGDRSSGIRVHLAGHAASPGMRADVTGKVWFNADSEKYIAAEGLFLLPGAAPEPLAVSCRWLGGAGDGYVPATGAGQPGVRGGAGLNNIGLFVRVFGRVTYVDPSGQFINVSDGSGVADETGRDGVQVWMSGIPLPAAGSYLEVKGISSCRRSGSDIYPRLLPRNGLDVRLVAD